MSTAEQDRAASAGPPTQSAGYVEPEVLAPRVPLPPVDPGAERFVSVGERGWPDTRKGTYSRTHASFKDRNGRPCAPPDVGKESCEDFIRRAGFSRTEGSSSKHSVAFFRELLQRNPWIRRVAEVGFNTGVSALTFLAARADVQVVSFDLGEHAYGYFAKVFVDAQFPGRHLLVTGDSTQSVPAFARQGVAPFDLVFVDGGHLFDVAMADLQNCRALAHERTVLLVDNISPHKGCGIGPYLAWRECVERGYLRHLAHVELGDYYDGFAVAQYVWPEARAPSAEAALEGDSEHCRHVGAGAVALPLMPGEPGVRVAAASPPDYRHMERRVRISELGAAIDAARSPEELARLEAEVAWLDALGRDYVDDWARRALAKVRQRLAEGATSRHHDGRGRGGGGGYGGGGGGGGGGHRDFRDGAKRARPDERR